MRPKLPAGSGRSPPAPPGDDGGRLLADKQTIRWYDSKNLASLGGSAAGNLMGSHSNCSGHVMKSDARLSFLLVAAGLMLCRVHLLGADPVPPAANPRPANYELAPGDAVAISVFREPDLTTQQRLSRDGSINFPLLGVVRIGGKTTNDAAALITSLLKQGYLIHPQVSVSILDYAKIKFTVLGQVAAPGAFEMSADQSVDLLTAIARAGGFTRIADPTSVVIRRVINGQEETLKVDAKKLVKGGKSERFLIFPNDMISVGESIF